LLNTWGGWILVPPCNKISQIKSIVIEYEGAIMAKSIKMLEKDKVKQRLGLLNNIMYLNWIMFNKNK